MRASFPRIFVTVGAIAMAAAMAACGGATSPPAAAGTTAASPRADSRPVTWTMPDLRGENLQTAQDAIQALTDNPVFYTASEDATGQGRHQINDRNWNVCSQVPAAGATFDDETLITFEAVKNSEDCP